MQITIELPEDIGVRLESKWKDLPRAALESLALEAYRISSGRRKHKLAVRAASMLLKFGDEFGGAWVIKPELRLGGYPS